MNDPIPNATDRRRELRTDTDVGACLDGNIRCRMVNVSRSGALAISQHSVPEFSSVKVHLAATIDGRSAELECVGAVVRCDPRSDGQFDIGLFFPTLTDTERERLAQIAHASAMAPAVG